MSTPTQRIRYTYRVKISYKKACRRILPKDRKIQILIRDPVTDRNRDITRHHLAAFMPLLHICAFPLKPMVAVQYRHTLSEAYKNTWRFTLEIYMIPRRFSSKLSYLYENASNINFPDFRIFSRIASCSFERD